MERTLANATDEQLAKMKQMAADNTNPALASHFAKLLKTVEAELDARRRGN